MLKRTLAVGVTALAVALGGAGAALADHGADDPPGKHQEHKNGEKRHHGKHKHHGRHHHEKGDDHGGNGDDGPNHT
jgi:Spy/CpxP family protein refolding chaperone